MTNYYGDDGMRQAFDNLRAKYERRNALDMAGRTADHVTVIDIPDTTSAAEQPINPISGRNRRDVPNYSNSPFKPRGATNGGSSNDTNRDVPFFATIHEDRPEDRYTQDDYDRINPERDSPYAETNGDPNAELKWSAVTSSVTGETYYKRPIRGIV